MKIVLTILGGILGIALLLVFIFIIYLSLHKKEFDELFEIQYKKKLNELIDDDKGGNDG